jgi:putative ABC transport system permease protein
MESLWQDSRYAIRVMARSRGFVAVAVLALALGIGANTAIFSVVDAVVFRALPYRDPARLVWITNFLPSQNADLIFADIYSAWRAQGRILESVAAYAANNDFTLTGTGGPERVHAGTITRSFLDTLGVAPQLGRNFSAQEDSPNGPKAAILSDALWRARFGGDPRVIGRVIALDDAPYTIVGVLPRALEFPDNASTDLLVPFQLADSSIENAGGRVTLRVSPMEVVARMRPGVTTGTVQSSLGAAISNIAGLLPSGFAHLFTNAQVQVVPLHDHEIGDIRQALLILLGAVGFVLLIACANVANLQLARGAAREKEIAIRGALGAGKRRIAQLLLTESAVVGLAGGAAGLALASGGLRLIERFGPTNVPHLANARLDVRVLLFTLSISLLTGVLFGLAPLIAAFRVPVNGALKESGAQAGSSVGARRPQKILMVVETALSLVLFIGAGLLIRSFLQLTAIRPGFDSQGVLTAQVSLPLDQYSNGGRQRAFFDQLLAKINAIPGVTSSGAAAALPLQGSVMRLGFAIAGQPPSEMERAKIPTASMNLVTPGYFTAMRTPLIAGRFLEERDGADAPSAVLINEAFARQFFPHGDALGQKLLVSGGNGPVSTIVGVVADVKQRSLTSEVWPEVFSPMAQRPTPRVNLAIRTSLPPLTLADAVRGAVAELNPDVPLYGVRTMDDLLADQLAAQRFDAAALAAFAGLAVLLAAVGIYGVMAYASAARTHEIGIRMALGAERSDVLRLVLRQGLGLSLLGIAIGLAASLGLTRLMSSLLYNVKPVDPLTFSLVTVALAGVALAACWFPAHRTTRVDPVIALRHE